MKDDMVDVLIYLYENYIGEPVNVVQEISVNDLKNVGFTPEEIDKAFDWLVELAARPLPQIVQKSSGRAVRIFTETECAHLNVACRCFLLRLEQLSLIDAFTRELIIQCVLALPTRTLNINQFKRIVLLVLLNQGEQELAVTWIEDLLYAEDLPTLH